MALMIPVVAGLPAVPPVATNAAFLNVYAQIPEAATNLFEHQVWAELNARDPLANRIHNYGQHYIHNLSQHSYATLSLGLQFAIAVDAWTAAGGVPLAPVMVKHLFVNNMLP